MPIKLVCFDLGNVLVRIRRNWAEACMHAGVGAGADLMNRPVLCQVNRITRNYYLGRIDDRAFDGQMAEVTGLPVQSVQAISRAWLGDPYAGFDDLLDELESRSVPTACLSNTNARHWAMMHGTQLSRSALPLQRLNYRLASHLIGAMKPDAAIYLQLERTAGIEPAAILFFDDNADNCHAAGQRGWRARQIDPDGDTVDQMRRHLAQWGLVS